MNNINKPITTLAIMAAVAMLSVCSGIGSIDEFALFVAVVVAEPTVLVGGGVLKTVLGIV